MALNDVNFITLNGGLGRTLAGDDSISGLVLPGSMQPLVSAKTQVFYSLQEAVDAGITASGATTEANYHIAQFYAQVAAPLYVTFSDGDFAEDIMDLQNFAVGAIKQVAVVDNAVFAVTTLNALQSAADAQIAAHRGVSVLYATDNFAGLTLSTLPTLASSNLPNVSAVISADARRTYSCVGAALGVLALAKVSENMGALLKFNVVKNDEFDTLKFLTGDLNKLTTPALFSQLQDKGYIFLSKYVGIAGSYFNDSQTATPSTSDFHFIENTRTMEKARRSLRTVLLPQLKSNLVLDQGKLSLPTISKFTLVCQNRLDQMVNESEISDYSVFIDPAQPVLSTSKLAIQIGIVPIGIARLIEVSIGFQLK